MTNRPLLLAAMLLFSSLLLPGASARRTRVGVAAERSPSARSSSMSSPSSLPPLAPRLVTSFHGQAPIGEIIPRSGRGTFPEFLVDLKRAADAKMVSKRPIEFLFDEGSFVLDCRGLFLEFGVFDATTLTLAANWRSQSCGPSSPPVFGFDTFEGLPETWDQGDGGDSWEKGSFDLEGRLPLVPDNARLVKGLFSETLPGFLAEARGLARHYPSAEEEAKIRGKKEEREREGGRAAAAAATASTRRRKRGASAGSSNDDAAAAGDKNSTSALSDLDAHVNPSGVGAAGSSNSLGFSSLHVSYLHIDCDLYAGARDALSLLSPLIRPGAVLVFDDLVNYPAYREHEVKALWEWVASTGLHLRVIGVKGPLPPVEEEEVKEKGEKEEEKNGENGENGGETKEVETPAGGRKPPPSSRNPPPPPRAVDLEPKRAAPHHHQSVAFVVV